MSEELIKHKLEYIVEKVHRAHLYVKLAEKELHGATGAIAEIENLIDYELYDYLEYLIEGTLPMLQFISGEITLEQYEAKGGLTDYGPDQKIVGLRFLINRFGDTQKEIIKMMKKNR